MQVIGPCREPDPAFVRAGPWRAPRQPLEVDANWLAQTHGPDGQLALGWLPEQAWGPAWIAYTRMEPGYFQTYRHNVKVDIDWSRAAMLWTSRRAVSPEETVALHSQAWMNTLHMLVLHHRGLMLHGASLRLNGRAVVVVGPSGAGKSTLSQRFSAAMIHDDVTLLARDGRQWQVWYQDADRPPPHPQPDETPVEALFYLGTRREKTAVRRLIGGEAMDLVAGQTYFAGGAATPALADAMADLLADLPVYELGHCLLDDTERVWRALTDPDGFAADEG